MILDLTTTKLELETATAAAIDYSTSYDNVTSTTFASAGTSGAISSATSTTIIAAPTSGTTRLIKRISAKNKSATVSQILQAKIDVSGTDYYVSPPITLRPGEELVYDAAEGWYVHSTSGARRDSDPRIADTTGRVIDWLKGQTAQETSGTACWYSAGKDTGLPGVWSPGSSGVNGRATDGTQVADAGCVPYVNPGGALLTYLTKFNVASGIVDRFCLVDVLWVNDGLNVTGLTEQTLTSAALPSRDAIGGSNGVGCNAGILVTTVTTNVADVTTITLNYTNTAGTTGRTATMTGFATSAVVGTVHWFELQTGDLGVKSIQGVTLGTSLVTGAISLIIARRIAGAAVRSLTDQCFASPLPSGGIRTYDGSCIMIMSTAASSGAAAPRGEIEFQNR